MEVVTGVGTGTGKTIEELPVELLLEVFSYLPFRDIASCSQVSSRWQSVAYSRRLWRNLKFDASGESGLRTALVIAKLAWGLHSLSLAPCHSTSAALGRGKAVLSLSPRAWERFRQALEDVAERLSPGLSELSVRGPECYLRHLHRLLVTTPFRRLTSFSALSHCGAAVDDAALKALCDHCSLLETLVLEGCSVAKLTAAGGLSRLSQLPRLQTLHLDRKLSPKDIEEMDACYWRQGEPNAEDRCTCEAHDLSFLVKCRSLVTLTLSPCNEFLCELPLLRSLTLKSEAVQADGERLDSAVRLLPHLEELSLIGFWRLDDEHVTRIRATAPVSSLFWLEQLHVDGVRIKIKFERP